jgi:Leucine-rich repeat (LRR) protein/GTPase SAR1 family protein
MTTSPEVIELIRENQQQRAKVLDLSFKKLTEIPEAVLQLTHLEELNLYGNEIQIIPDTLRQLPLLRRLDICGNPIEQLSDINGLILDYDIFLAQRHHLTPAHIVCLQLRSISDEIVNDLLSLPQLTSLDLSRNQLSTLPESFGKLTQLTSLYLEDNQLSTLPESFGKLTQLTSLDLEDNRLSTLPESFGKLTQLTSLDLSRNQLSTLPESFGKLAQLTSLDLRNNQLLSTLPKSFDKLTQLTSLDLSRNQLSTLPESFGKLTQLTSLDLSSNRLSTLPESFDKLTQLTSLDLSSNRLSTLPESFGKLTQLTSLDLSSNRLSTLPESFGKLTQLTSLDLRLNQLKIIPNDIRQLTDLKELELDFNPIENPPAEIVHQGIDALREYFAALDGGAVTNNKAKLILVGNGRVGKTCISKVLAGEPCEENEKSTHGIRVVTLKLPHAPKIEFQVWDFGGQGIYHATHRLFLSHRALYLLVWDSDTEERARISQLDGEFTLDYWLDNIAALSGNSPVLVVQNKVDDTPPLPLPQDKLTKSYQIKEFLKVSAKTGRGFEELKQHIAAQFQSEQPLYRMVGYEMPKTWLDLRDELHDFSKKRHSITYQNFLTRCKKFEINETAAAVLCRFLHETASILYFLDEPKLKDRIAINPRWIAEKIYDDENGVLNRQVEEQHGKFTRAHVRCQLAKLSEAEQDNFINLLRKFELCFKVADPAAPDTFIAPQYLPLQRPASIITWEWKTPQPPKFIYEYQRFIHNSVMARFIARFGHLAQRTDYCWRDGILFEQHDAIAFALVECHPQNKTITVHLKRDSTGQLAHQVYTNFNEINDFLSVTLFVTCCCADCENSEDFHRYEVEKLQEFITEKQKKTVECPKSGHTVEIIKLVGGAVVQAWLKREDDSYPPIHKAVEKEPIEEAEPIENTKETSPEIDMTTTEESEKWRKWFLKLSEWGKGVSYRDLSVGILLWIVSELMALVFSTSMALVRRIFTKLWSLIVSWFTLVI